MNKKNHYYLLSFVVCFFFLNTGKSMKNPNLPLLASEAVGLFCPNRTSRTGCENEDVTVEPWKRQRRGNSKSYVEDLQCGCTGQIS